MADSNAPKVKLPDAIQRKPLVPGPNSWAQQQRGRPRNNKADQISDTRPTNRDKYEHKPMPPPPPSEEAPSQGSYLLQSRAYIQPAIPLIIPPKIQNQKNRAVTDPVAPKPLFADRKVSVSQLRKKYSQSKVKGDSSKEDSEEDIKTSSAIQVAPEKAAQILGIPPLPNNVRNTSPTSAPVQPTSNSFCTPHEECQGNSSARQVQSSPIPTRCTPVPTRRYLKENGLSVPTTTEVSGGFQQQSTKRSQPAANGAEETVKHMPASSFLVPPRVGSHNNVGEAELVEGSFMHRVESFRGVIEDGPTSSGIKGQECTESYAESSPFGDALGHHVNSLLSPNLYSPGNYGGVWENDPAVGHTLPPFTPIPRARSANTESSAHGDSAYVHPYINLNANMNHSSRYGLNRVSNYRDPLPSANSWASNNSNGNSFAPPSAPLSALLPPRWPHGENVNSVPSPPLSQHDFQRAGSISASLAQLDLTLHHHIDSTFGTLSRMMTDKHDRIMDQTIRRLENLEDTLSTVFRDLKSEFGDLKKHLSELQMGTDDVMKRGKGTVETITAVHDRLIALEKHVEDLACKCQHSSTEQNTSEPESGRHRRSKTTSNASHRRTESAHPFIGQTESRQHYQTGVSRTSSNARASGASSRRNRSNTVNSQQQPTSRMSDERSNRREHFAELGAARGPVPDLRDHPAFADRQHVQQQAFGYGGLHQDGMPMVLNGLPYENPSLSDGRWYQQAYGQHN